MWILWFPAQSLPTLVRLRLTANKPPLFYLSVKTGKSLVLNATFIFSVLAEVQSRQVLHRLHWDNSLMFLEINFNGWMQAVDPGFIWKFAGMASRAYGKLLTHVVFH